MVPFLTTVADYLVQSKLANRGRVCARCGGLLGIAKEERPLALPAVVGGVGKVSDAGID